MKSSLKLSTTLVALSLFFLTLSSSADDATKNLEQIDGNDRDLNVWDPIEPVNRGIFWFNNQFDYLLFEPLARGYDWIVPEPAQKGVENFFNNLRYPIYFVSDLIRLEFSRAGEDTGRFLLNSTVGLAGIFDVAKEVGWEGRDNGIDVALASLGIPPGPYLVLPFLGPSNLRDGIGRIGNVALHPLTYITTIDGLSDNQALAWSIGAWAVEFTDQRAGLLDTLESARKNSLDYYLFLQSAYYQYKRGLLLPEEKDGRAAAADAQKMPSDDELLNDELVVEPANK